MEVKKWLDNGEIGEVRQVHVSLMQSVRPLVLNNIDKPWRVNPEVAGGGYFYDLASHQLDLLDFLLGPIATASGQSANQGGLYNAEDSVTACWQFENGVLGSGNWCFSAAKSAECDRVQITGSEGMIDFPVFGKGVVTLHKTRSEPLVLEFELPKHIQQPLITAIVGNLINGTECDSTGESAARTNRVMEQIVKQ